MSYTALYRKFRPGEFEDVKGQEHIVTTLRNQIKTGRIGHAYLFTGTRGTGKTTVAKIFAKAVNCESPKDGSPCGKCRSCQAISSGASSNVIEMDAASNNGVDSIREIIDEVSYSPVEGKYKVYIIDEVHMLSPGAFNALLKTLEEPPGYCIFILATTEVHKIPITILSRCQRYDFKRINIETITDRLRGLMDIEGVAVEDRALTYIAKTADGSMRDALSLLDQCIAFHFGQELTYEKVLEVLGTVDTEVFSRLIRGIIARDATLCLNILEEVVMQGRELTQFVIDITWYLRNLLLIKTSPDTNIENIVDMSAENIARLKEETTQLDTELIMRYIRIFSALADQVKYASQKRVQIEMTLIKLCNPEMETTNEAIVDRLEKIEDRLEKGEFNIPQPPIQDSTPAPTSYTKESQPSMPLPEVIPQNVQKIVDEWKNVVNNIGSKAWSKYLGDKFVRSVSCDDKGNLVLVCVDGCQIHNQLTFGENAQAKREYLEKYLSSYAGSKVNILVKSDRDTTTYKDLRYKNIDQSLQENIMADVVVEDE